MKLHEMRSEFNDLVELTSKWKNITSEAVRRDYYIVLILDRLQKSDYAEKCVFKGGNLFK